MVCESCPTMMPLADRQRRGVFFGTGGEWESVAPRQVANGASGSAPSQPPHMDAEQDQDWLETQDAG